MSIDVMVMAFAATFGGALVDTSDLDDLQRLYARTRSLSRRAFQD